MTDIKYQNVIITAATFKTMARYFTHTLQYITMKRIDNQNGLIPMLVFLFIVVVGVIIFVYMRVISSTQ